MDFSSSSSSSLSLSLSTFSLLTTMQGICKLSAFLTMSSLLLSRCCCCRRRMEHAHWLPTKCRLFSTHCWRQTKFCEHPLMPLRGSGLSGPPLPPPGGESLRVNMHMHIITHMMFIHFHPLSARNNSGCPVFLGCCLQSIVVDFCPVF